MSVILKYLSFVLVCNILPAIFKKIRKFKLVLNVLPNFWMVLILSSLVFSFAPVSSLAQPAPTPTPSKPTVAPKPTTTPGKPTTTPETKPSTAPAASSGSSGKATPNLNAVRQNDCAGQKTPLTVLALMQPAKFFPVIPKECGGDLNAGPKAMSLAALPVILVRVYGLLASLVFFLFGFNLVFASIRFSYGAFQEAEYGKSLNMIQEGFSSIALVLLAHLIISTIFSSILKIPLETDAASLQQFFT